MNRSGVTPLSGRVIILIDERQDIKDIEKKSSIIIPESAKKVQGTETTEMLGKIVAIGDGCFEGWDLAPNVGATIMFDRYAGKIFLGADQSVYRMMSYASVAGIVTEGADIIKPYELRGV